MYIYIHIQEPLYVSEDFAAPTTKLLGHRRVQAQRTNPLSNAVFDIFEGDYTDPKCLGYQKELDIKDPQAVVSKNLQKDSLERPGMACAELATSS